MLGKNLCTLVKNGQITILLNHPTISGIIINPKQLLVDVGYDEKKDDIIYEDWANKDLEPLFFMQVIFENEEMIYD